MNDTFNDLCSFSKRNATRSAYLMVLSKMHTTGFLRRQLQSLAAVDLKPAQKKARLTRQIEVGQTTATKDPKRDLQHVSWISCERIEDERMEQIEDERMERLKKDPTFTVDGIEYLRGDIVEGRLLHLSCSAGILKIAIAPPKHQLPSIRHENVRGFQLWDGERIDGGSNQAISSSVGGNRGLPFRPHLPSEVSVPSNWLQYEIASRRVQPGETGQDAKPKRGYLELGVICHICRVWFESWEAWGPHYRACEQLAKDTARGAQKPQVLVFRSPPNASGSSDPYGEASHLHKDSNSVASIQMPTSEEASIDSILARLLPN